MQTLVRSVLLDAGLPHICWVCNPLSLPSFVVFCFLSPLRLTFSSLSVVFFGVGLLSSPVFTVGWFNFLPSANIHWEPVVPGSELLSCRSQIISSQTNTSICSSVVTPHSTNACSDLAPDVCKVALEVHASFISHSHIRPETTQSHITNCGSTWFSLTCFLHHVVDLQA